MELISSECLSELQIMNFHLMDRLLLIVRKHANILVLDTSVITQLNVDDKKVDQEFSRSKELIC